LLVFVTLGVFILLAPAYHEFLGGGTRHMPNWAMFYNASIGQCRAEFFSVDAAGARTTVDRVAAMKLEGVRAKKRTLKGKKAVAKQGKRLCRALQLEDVRVTAACASYKGWEPAFEGRRNLCEANL
jgi:hypothetical protein